MRSHERIESVDRLAKAGRLQESLELLDSFIRDSPEDPEPWAFRGHLQIEEGNYEDAASDLSRAIALNPLEPEYFLTRGRCCLAIGSFQAAVVDFTETLRLCDYHGADYYREVAHFFRAEALLGLRMYDEAQAECEHIRDGMVLWTTGIRSKQDLINACLRKSQ